MTSWRVERGDCVEVMASMPAASIDAVVCDPPYLISFMGKEFDSGRTGCRAQEWHEAWAREALRVLKPGGHMLAAGGSRTYHRLTCAIEDAGFEVRDCITHLYGSGFPKSLDVSKAIDRAAGAEREVVGTHPWAHVRAGGATRDDGATYGEGKTRGPLTVTAPATPDAERWQGWGTALKPAAEFWVLARKPLGGSVNVKARVEHELRVRGVEGEIRWTSAASDAAGPSLTTSSGSTERLRTAGTSAETVSGSATQPTASATRTPIERTLDAGEPITPTTPEPRTDAGTANSARPSSPPMDQHVDAAESTASHSSPSTTSTEAAQPIGKQTTATSTLNCDDSDSPTATESFAGIATGLTGSPAHVLIRRNGHGDFEWPDDLPEVVAVGPTVAANCLEHGTGALNVDGCRIGYEAGGTKASNPSLRDSINGGNGGHVIAHEPDRRVVTPDPSGRWPANVVLSHKGPDVNGEGGCKQTGTRRVKGHAGYPNGPRGNQFSVGETPDGSRTEPWPGHADADGLETVPAWACEPECPVRILDEQSGTTTSTGGRIGNAGGGSVANLPTGAFSAGDPGFGDSGGASRFFYTAKASSAERSAGLNGFEASPTQALGRGLRNTVSRCPEHDASLPSGSNVYACGCAQAYDNVEEDRREVAKGGGRNPHPLGRR